MQARLVTAGALAALAVAALPATSVADGLPAVGIDAKPLGLPDGRVEYITKGAGPGARPRGPDPVRIHGNTRLVERARYGGPLRVRRLRGSFAIPAVAYDGSPGGLSADGRTLILISPRTRFPRKRTNFAVIDTRRLTVRRHVSLRGDFSFDAISPNGRTMYLIEYDGRNVADYAVRGYDVRTSRLLPRPIVDPHEADEPMRGVPVTRVPGRDGRWQYTLYDNGDESFVHALDTRDRTAICIDLDVKRAWGSSLTLRNERLDVIGRGARVVASIDTTTHRVIAPQPKATRRRAENASTSWLPLAAPAAVLLLIAAATRRRMLKKRPAPPITEAWEPPSDRHAPTA